MGHKKRSQRARGSSGNDAKERDLATIHLINTLLDAQPVDFAQLRKVTAVRGLVNNQLRTRVWPVLLGVDGLPFDEERYAAQHSTRHRDSSTVECDVERSLWSYTEGWSVEEREVRRRELRRLLNATVCSRRPGEISYYQGLHDIAAVLLFVAGERPAAQMLARMAVCHLRDCTRPSLDAVIELLALLLPILASADPPLAAHVDSSGVPPFFALSLFITWFAHNLARLGQAARLFDLFIASHPLMPLYAAVAVLVASRERILAAEPDPAEMHSLLSNLPPLGAISADELAQSAVAIYRRCPPKQLLRAHRGIRLVTSTAAESYLKGDFWHVPDKPAVPVGKVGRDALHNLAAYVMPANGKKFRRQAGAVASVTVASLVAAVSVGLFIAQQYQSQAQ